MACRLLWSLKVTTASIEAEASSVAWTSATTTNDAVPEGTKAPAVAGAVSEGDELPAVVGTVFGEGKLPVTVGTSTKVEENDNGFEDILAGGSEIDSLLRVRFMRGVFWVVTLFDLLVFLRFLDLESVTTLANVKPGRTMEFWALRRASRYGKRSETLIV